MSQIDVSAKPQTTDKYIPPNETTSRQWYTGYPQRYSGDVLYDNIHGNGFYSIEKGDKLFYDGLFYANKLEGYSHVFYEDGSHFQGLFNDHKRLGPGVLTYRNGEQDVGLWNGFSIARLETSVQPNMIPRLGYTSSGKIKLVKYRYLVPVCPGVDDLATEVLKNLDANDQVQEKSQMLYNLEVENKQNLFFNKKIFDEKFYPVQDCMIDILVPEDNKEEAVRAEEEVEVVEEEKPCEGPPLDLKRIRMISNELESIELKLENVRANKYIISKKVEYCRLCCFGAQVEQEATPSFETISAEAGSLEDEEKSTTYLMINYEKYEEDRISQSINADSMFKIDDYLVDTCDCHEAMDIDDLASLEKLLESIETDERFYETIKKNLQEKLRIHLKKAELCETVKTQQVVVNELLAWNNEELSMRMLKHSFLHRRSEYMVTFNVSSLLRGERKIFAKPGLHERNNVQFLENCAKGDTKTVLETIRKNKINVNVCDARGNSAIFFASANGQNEVVPILANFGAKLTQLNDEGLTPLALCLLIYLALHHDRYDWENSFLPELLAPMEDQRDLPKWYPDNSLLSLSKTDQNASVISHDTIPNSSLCDNKLLGGRIQKVQESEAAKEAYLFDTSFKIFKEPKKAKGKSKTKAKPTKISLEIADKPTISPEMELKEKMKLSTENIVKTLLEYGADPNVGEVPLPPLILSVFSENRNLVRSILSTNADANVLVKDNMSALHIVVSLKCVEENIEICKALLEARCNPNLRTSTNHWPQQKVVVLGKNKKAEEYEDCGKTALQVLCLRKDYPTDTCHYFETIADMLIKDDINPNNTYLGHTALSLAVLSGNINLVETLLRVKPLPINPHQVLEYNMGNVLTLFILKRYDNILPVEKCKDMLRVLVSLDVNPLNPIDNFENAIEFMEKEHEVIKVDKGKGKGKGKKDKKSKSSRASSKTSKKGKKGKVQPQEILKEYLKELARDTIIKYIQFEATEYLYSLTEANMLECNSAKVLAEFLTPPTGLENLALIFNHKRIKHARFNKDVCLEVLEFVEKNQRIVKTKKGKDKKKGKKEKKGKGKKSKGSSKSSTSQEPPSEPPPPTYTELIDRTDFAKKKRQKAKFRLKRPGLDDISKYTVCFHCLRRANRLLLLCPRCQFVYYCSEQCNKQNIKMKAQHFCNLNFYKTQKQRFDLGDALVDENLHDLSRFAAIKCEELLVRKQEEEREARRRWLEEEKKNDIYGTRFLKNKVVSEKVALRFNGISAVTSLVSSATPNFVMNPPLCRRLTQLSLKDDKYIDMVSQKHVGSLRGSDDEAEQDHKDEIKRKKKSAGRSNVCRYKEKVSAEKIEEPSEKRGKNVDLRKTQMATAFSKAEVIAEPGQIVRKMRKIPSKYQYFIELLSQYFPDVDLSFLFLPYACYCNGHLYYKFLDDNIFSRTYSMM